MRFYTLLLLPALLACSQPAAESSAPAATGARPAQAPAGAFPETFETGSKSAYETADVALVTGPWLFTNGLIGSTEQDHKAGEHAARLRAGGKLTMQFDAPAGIRRISVLAAAYGNDGPSTWELWVSRDHGRTWQRNGQPQTATGPALRPALFAGLANEPLRLEIRKTDAGKGRLNLDDIRLETAGGPVAAAPAGRPAPSPAPAPTDDYFKNRNTPAPTPVRPVQAPSAGSQLAGIDNDNLLLGNPSGATSDPSNNTNYLLTRPQFATGYNAQRGIPIWTSWHVGRTDITKNAPRQNDFRTDPGLPRQFYQVTPQSYGGSGFDKGHNCPSGDRTAALDDNSATFLMSNMVPQAPQNNQQTWAHLEEYTRAQVEAGQEAYVLMGSYGRGGTGKNGPASTIDQGRVTVPAHVWKVIIFLPEGSNDRQRIIAGQGRVLAIDTPNDNSISPQWPQYLTSVDKIEAASGLDIFSALPAATQAQLQSVVDSGRAAERR
ncbi:DNA/RNA non-specific endonuclease [Hymenobacter sp. H14-R3]|uniref:DNA/RNA non-specific endonuclease n=1 Tax=Hymenobacter sp. H14-R3 TaxID=3046308 RepID=UPI0024BBE205|nr:DNA/RNA non-specific endonuclease [Hymenobacter sp. H14-R3]MDJ0363893.1 DNA/RNA non-specific endonuclease [Hymenobacter sp. H14-R3]